MTNMEKLEVFSAQLSVGNSAKAVISCFQIPSWFYDPSEELLEVITKTELELSSFLVKNF